ncbi:MAG: FAD binding domain-containing protein, partial [Hyphomicrobiaceae bacterium]
MSQIAFHRATSLADACAILAETGARSLAGGTDLIVQVREARREVHTLVEIKQIPELISVIDRDDGGLTVGAAIPAARLARTDSLVQTYPALAAALGMIGSRQIQNRATLGGNVCNASPSADAVPPLIAYDADGLIAGKDGTRRVPLQELFRGPGETCLAPDEILVAIDLPPRPAMSAASY